MRLLNVFNEQSSFRYCPTFIFYFNIVLTQTPGECPSRCSFLFVLMIRSFLWIPQRVVLRLSAPSHAPLSGSLAPAGPPQASLQDSEKRRGFPTHGELWKLIQCNYR